MTLDAQLEAVLFVSAKPLSLKRLVELCESSADDVNAALASLKQRLTDTESGLMLQEHGNEIALVTKPEVAELVGKVVHVEAFGELSRPSLEALTILAYRGPLTRPELEQVRGVQSSLILRNLMLRGLVEEKEDTRLGQPIYAVTFEFLNAIGVPSVEGLPDYHELRGSAAISDVLAALEAAPAEPSSQTLNV